MSTSEEAYLEEARRLRRALMREELARVRIAAWGLVLIALGLLVFLGCSLRNGADEKGPAWSYVALLGVAALLLAVPLIAKFNFSKDGGGVDFVNPVELIDRLESKAQAARVESFEQTRLQISGLSQQIEEIAAALEAAQLARTSIATGIEPKRQAVREPTLIDIRGRLKPVTDQGDQQKGRFNGQESRDGRRLKAEVSPSEFGKPWQKVVLTLLSENAKPLEGTYAFFFLHETFDPDTYRVKMPAGAMQVSLETAAVGAFTAGVAAERGETMLEIDLAKSPSVSAPAWWRKR